MPSSRRQRALPWPRRRTPTSPSTAPTRRRTSPSGSKAGASSTRRPAAGWSTRWNRRRCRRFGAVSSASVPEPFTSFELKNVRLRADVRHVDAAEREEIMSRYLDYSRRFEAAAARRQNGNAEVIPFAPPLRELEQEPTMREIEVLQLVADGLVNREIGVRLYLSEETVKSHVRHLLAKLQARSRAHAVAIGFRRGLIA